MVVYNSFVVNPIAPVQETLCLLQNDTTASSPTVSPSKAVSTYYMVKLNIRSGKGSPFRTVPRPSCRRLVH